MSETIVLTDKDLDCGPQGTFFGWFLMEALGAYLDTSKIPWNPSGTMEISLTIDGHQIPIRPVIDRIEANLDRLVLAKSQEMLKGKLNSISSAVDQIDKHTENLCRELLGSRYHEYEP